MYLKIICTLIVSILIIGCSSSPKPKPEWILNPTFDGKMSVSASAPFQDGDRDLQERVAKMHADASISQHKQVLIDDFCISETSTSGASMTQCKSELLSVDFTLGVKIIDRWIDKETNILYIRAIPKKTYFIN